jgi:hypothetical protein
MHRKPLAEAQNPVPTPTPMAHEMAPSEHRPTGPTPTIPQHNHNHKRTMSPEISASNSETPKRLRSRSHDGNEPPARSHQQAGLDVPPASEPSGSNGTTHSNKPAHSDSPPKLISIEQVYQAINRGFHGFGADAAEHVGHIDARFSSLSGHQKTILARMNQLGHNNVAGIRSVGDQLDRGIGFLDRGISHGFPKLDAQIRTGFTEAHGQWVAKFATLGGQIQGQLEHVTGQLTALRDVSDTNMQSLHNRISAHVQAQLNKQTTYLDNSIRNTDTRASALLNASLQSQTALVNRNIGDGFAAARNHLDSALAAERRRINTSFDDGIRSLIIRFEAKMDAAERTHTAESGLNVQRFAAASDYFNSQLNSHATTLRTAVDTSTEAQKQHVDTGMKDQRIFFDEVMERRNREQGVALADVREHIDKGVRKIMDELRR